MVIIYIKNKNPLQFEAGSVEFYLNLFDNINFTILGALIS